MVRQAVEFMKIIPEIREVKVRASSEALVKDSPLMFEVTVAWLDGLHSVHVEWSPNQDAHELYSSAAKKLVGLGWLT